MIMKYFTAYKIYIWIYDNLDILKKNTNGGQD